MVKSIPTSRLSSELGFSAGLKCRALRRSGAQLDRAFLTMASHVVDEADTESIVLAVEGRSLPGIRYQRHIYRHVDSFPLCYRLQAYCLAHTLDEQQVRYLITRSAHRFAVWVDTQTFSS